MKIIFTIVLFNNKIDEIMPLIKSINQFTTNKSQTIEVFISIIDNSPKPIKKNILAKLFNSNAILFFKADRKNYGYGVGHNKCFKKVKDKVNLTKKDLLIVTNPDIYFEHNELTNIINFLKQDNKNEITCLSPLLKNHKNEIQFSAKYNPTLLSLIIGRLGFLENINFLKEYISINQNRKITTKKIISCSFLSGCFLIIRVDAFEEIKGFDERYFLHFEDADITRELSLLGKCIHYPFALVYHRWNRGSHKSLKQTVMLIKSMIKYFKKWGLKIF